MNRHKRKPFLIKGNFQIAFVIGFIILLLAEAMAAGLIIYRLSERAVEQAEFSSHITIERTDQVIRPIIIKVNTYFILISFLLGGAFVLITYLKLRALFGKMIKSLENLKDNRPPTYLALSGGKNTRELIKEFNQAGAYLDKQKADLRIVLDRLLSAKELGQIKKLHYKLSSIIACGAEG